METVIGLLIARRKKAEFMRRAQGRPNETGRGLIFLSDVEIPLKFRENGF
jgi:hypothetical protein